MIVRVFHCSKYLSDLNPADYHTSLYIWGDWLFCPIMVNISLANFGVGCSVFSLGRWIEFGNIDNQYYDFDA